MTGKRRRLLFSAAALTLLLLGACGALIWDQLDQEEQVSSEVQSQLVGEMEVLKEIGASNPAGADGYEILYLVVRPEQADFFPGEYIKGLGESGWNAEPKAGESTGYDVWRREPDVLASVRPLSEYLESHADDDPQNGAVSKKLGRDFSDPEGLLLITAQPSG
ncbi:hypothetical protein [Streptomyces sp. NPDC054837]